MNNQKSVKPKTKMLRHLKISSKYRKRLTRQVAIVPELRLCGDWLAAAGFAVGGSVEIEVSQDQLIIKKRDS